MERQLASKSDDNNDRPMITTKDEVGLITKKYRCLVKKKEELFIKKFCSRMNGLNGQM